MQHVQQRSLALVMMAVGACSSTADQPAPAPTKQEGGEGGSPIAGRPSGVPTAGSAGAQPNQVVPPSAGSRAVPAAGSGGPTAPVTRADDVDAGASDDAGVAQSGGNGYRYKVSNVDNEAIAWASAPAAKLNCGTTQIDTSGAVSFKNWCGTQPKPVLQAQGGSEALVVIPLSGLTLAEGNNLVLTGSRPVVLLVQGDAAISGSIDVSAHGEVPGPGGDLTCGASTGGDGLGREDREGGGGGGGGFGTAGGQGGDDRSNKSEPGIAGRARGTIDLIPLIGGCAGGHGGGCASVPGAGGGALQLSVGGSLRVSGSIRADGGLGANACSNDGGGAGGGSGGSVLLEAQSIDVTGARIRAAGGGGGAGQRNARPGTGALTPQTNGSAGEQGNGSGAGGGGGGYGRVRVHALGTCTGC